MENKKVMFEFGSDINRVRNLGTHIISLIRGHIEKLEKLNDISCYMKAEESKNIIASAQMDIWTEIADYTLKTITTPDQVNYLKCNIEEIEQSGEFCDERCNEFCDEQG